MIFKFWKHPVVVGSIVAILLVASDSLGFTNIGLTLNVNAGITNNLDHHWTFDGGDGIDLGQTDEVRSRVSSTHGDFINMDSANVSIATMGQGLEFNGTDEYVDFGDDATLEISMPLTVSAWINLRDLPGPTAPNNLMGIIGKYDPAAAAGEWALVIDNNDKIQFYNSYDAGGFALPVIASSTTSFTSSDLNTWRHVAFSLENNGDWTIYLDGEVDATGSYGGAITTYAGANDARIGALNYSGGTGYYFDGFIDDVRIYSRALTDSNVKRMYEMGATTKIAKTIKTNYQLQDGLVAHWAFDGSDFDYTSETTNTLDTFNSYHGLAYGFAGGEWLSSDFTYRVPITIQSSEVDSTLTDFPVYVDLSDLPAGFWSNVQADGDDIRVTTSDGTTELPIELVSIATSTTSGELHFKADSISSSVDTDFYIYYGNATATAYTATSTYGAENVWTNSYVGVWHLEEDTSGVGTTDLYLDSTSNTNDGDDQVSDTGKTGQLGRGQDFDGSNDYINVPDDNTLDLTGDITVSAWVRIDSTSDALYGIVEKSAGTGSFYQYSLWYDNRTSQGSPDRIRASQGGTGVSYLDYSPAGSLFTSYEHLLYTANNTDGFRTYIGGSLVATGTKTSINSANNLSLAIGAFSGNSSYSIDGAIDEVRIASTIRSASWVAAEYSNQNNPTGFYNVGAEESVYAEVKNFVTGGRLGQALTFDEVNDYIEVPYSAALNPSEYTVAAWVKVGSFASTQTVISSRAITANDEGYILYIRNGQVQLWNGNGFGAPTWIKLLGSTIETDRWYHLVGTFDGTNQRLYIDGELDVGPQVATLDTNTENPLRIGAGQNESTPDFFFNGAMDDVRVYNRALSADEIKRLYGLGATTKISKTLSINPNNAIDNPEHHWTFDGNDGFDISQADEVRSKTSSTHGDLVSMDAGSVAIGAQGQALDFDGSSDYINFGDDATLELTMPYSVSAWIKPRSFPAGVAPNNFAGIIGKGDLNTNFNEWLLYIDDNQSIHFSNYVNFGPFTFPYEATSTALTTDDLNEWTHILFVFDDGGGANPDPWSLYINGVLDKSGTHGCGTCDPYAGTNDAMIGAIGYNGGAGYYFDGLIDDVRIYNAALTDRDALQLYSRGAPN